MARAETPTNRRYRDPLTVIEAYAISVVATASYAGSIWATIRT